MASPPPPLVNGIDLYPDIQTALPPLSTSSAIFTLATAARIDIMNPTVVRQYKSQTRVKKGQFVVPSDALKNGIIIPNDIEICEAYIYLFSSFQENQFYKYYLTVNQRANVKAASKLLSNYLRNYPLPIVTQWGSCMQIKADVKSPAYSNITGYSQGQTQYVLIKFKKYKKDKDAGSDSGSDSGSSSS